ncbi:hypothetical protein QBC35DRAFT_498547 [Podospora australis]|uniref:Peptidase A1 domain-containing protein n=1 Tax=Podospora australis TaxID=1536484 RepID=A0AAN6WU57_9PEZI|nr:hypothetical protein QBC35DRAFT_498547 [Podospora australis]
MLAHPQVGLFIIPFLTDLAMAGPLDDNFGPTRTLTGRIPFLEYNAMEPISEAFDAKLHVTALFGARVTTAHSIDLYVDTGSTGIIISAADYPGYYPGPGAHPVPGFHYLSSSRTLYTGYWITQTIHFRDNSPTTIPGPFDTRAASLVPGEVKYITTTVQVLAVTKKYICAPDTGYDIDAPGDSCIGTPDETYDDPRGIRVMGIGFGRTHDGQPQGTPDRNPLLKITHIAGHSTADTHTSAYWPGYFIERKGITVGLTDTNTASMVFGPLVRGSTGTTEYWDLLHEWPEVPACIKITAPAALPGVRPRVMRVRRCLT